MNSMQDFYANISSKERLKDAYVSILVEITKLSREQMSALKSDMTWQDWSTDNQAQPQIQA